MSELTHAAVTKAVTDGRLVTGQNPQSAKATASQVAVLHDCSVTYRLNGRIAAVATISCDRVSLEAEVAMERYSY